MNITEAKVILQCRRSIRPGDVWSNLKFYGMKYSINYVYSILSRLAKEHHLIKREVNDGGSVGRTIYYTAPPEIIVQALNVIECHALQKIRSGVVVAPLSSYIHSMKQ
jgi:hypothetical protein